MKSFDQVCKDNGCQFVGGGLVITFLDRNQYEQMQADALNGWPEKLAELTPVDLGDLPFTQRVELFKSIIETLTHPKTQT